MKRQIVIAWLLLVCSIITEAQGLYKQEIDLQELIENIFATQELDINYNDLYETFLQFYTNPINLNNTSKEELRSLYILSEIQITNYTNYVESNGALISTYELQAIPDFDLTSIRKLLPFVTTTSTSTDQRPLFKRITTEKNNYLFLRYEQTIQTKKGYQDSVGYLGSSGKFYSRFRVSKSKDFSIGFTAEKDAGEELVWNTANKQYGMDFYSFHFQVQNKGRLKNLIVGDYRLQLGQGLVLNSGFNIGKGSETIATARKYNLGAMPYTSVLESGYFRGAAVTYNFGSIDLTGFISSIQNDANIQNDTTLTDVDEFISALQNTGFHRTEKELANMNQIQESNYGGSIQFNTNNQNFQFGAVFLQTHYEKPLIRPSNYYNGFEFNGTKNRTGSMFGSYQWQNINFFGELAMSSSSGIGGVAGTMISLTHQLDMAIVARHYDKEFHSFYGSGFGENTRNINETGIYWGIKYQPAHNVKISAYYDKFSFPWLKFRVKSPSEGYEYLIKAEYAFSKTIKVYAQFRQENKELNHREETLILDRVLNGVKKNYVFNADYATGDNLSFKSRVQSSSYAYNGITTKGYAVMQDITATIRKFKFSGRYALFQTDNYENRQYVYEKDVLYAFSIPAYNGIGTRAYLLLQYKLSNHWQFWIRYANTYFQDRDIIGSGSELIINNRKSDIKLQVKISF